MLRKQVPLLREQFKRGIVVGALYTLCQFEVVSPPKTLPPGHDPLKRCQVCRVGVWVNE